MNVNFFSLLHPGQLQAALERRRSFGRGRTLAVDEEVAKGEKIDKGQNRVADFMRRSFKKIKSRDNPKNEVELIEAKDSSKDSPSTLHQEVSQYIYSPRCTSHVLSLTGSYTSCIVVM